MIWAGGGLVAFSLISGKQIHYLLPELPAVALLLSRGSDRPPGRWSRHVPMLPAIVILGLGAAAAAGLVPAGILDGGAVGPVELVLATVTVAAALVLVATARSRSTARLVVAPATLVAFLLVAFQTVWAGNNPGRLAPLLAAHARAGVATTDPGYAGQFSFSARLPAPVTVLRSEGALAVWMQANPGGLVLGKAPIPAAGLQLLREDTLQGERWFAYRVGTGP
jgi:hypothetical protein